MSLFDAILARKLTGGGALPKPIPYEYMPDGYPRQEEEIVEITFDGTIEGYETVDVSDMFGTEAYFVKVSDTIPKAEDLVGGSLELSQPNNYMPSGTISADMLIDVGGGNYAVGVELTLVVTNPESAAMGITFPSAGVWFAYSPGGSYYKSLRYSAKTVTPIAEKFLPFYVANISEDENGALSCNMTGTEIYEALCNRIPVMGFYSDGLSCRNSGVDAVFDDSGAFTHCEVCSHEVYPDGTVGGGGK